MLIAGRFMQDFSLFSYYMATFVMYGVTLLLRLLRRKRAEWLTAFLIPGLGYGSNPERILKKITEKLTSLYFTTWTLIVMFTWFSWGIVLASCENFSRGFDLMNSTLVRNWPANSDNEFFLLKFWFVGLCAAVAFLGINLIFCSWPLKKPHFCNKIAAFPDFQKG